MTVKIHAPHIEGEFSIEDDRFSVRDVRQQDGCGSVRE